MFHRFERISKKLHYQHWMPLELPLSQQAANLCPVQRKNSFCSHYPTGFLELHQQHELFAVLAMRWVLLLETVTEQLWAPQ